MCTHKQKHARTYTNGRKTSHAHIPQYLRGDEPGSGRQRTSWRGTAARARVAAHLGRKKHYLKRERLQQLCVYPFCLSQESVCHKSNLSPFFNWCYLTPGAALTLVSVMNLNPSTFSWKRHKRGIAIVPPIKWRFVMPTVVWWCCAGYRDRTQQARQPSPTTCSASKKEKNKTIWEQTAT